MHMKYMQRVIVYQLTMQVSQPLSELLPVECREGRTLYR